MKRRIRTLKELENELALLKEKQGLQESWFRSSLSSLKESLSPSAIFQNIITKVVSSMIFSGKGEGFSAGSLKGAVIRRIMRFVAGVRNKFSSSK